jgi:hypothetical protein
VNRADRAVAVEIAAFFDEFQEASRVEDWPRYGDLFLPEFLNIDPGSATVLQRDRLIAFLPQRREIFERAAASGTALATLEVDALDDRNAFARTEWDVLFTEEHPPVTLRTTFLLRLEDRWRIAVYLNHGTLLELLGLA